MKSKEEKLTEALKEYFGNDVGDIKDVIAVPRNRCLDLENNMKDYNDFLIMTEPHQPTFKDKLEDLIDQLEKKLKKIDGDFNVKIEGDRICIYLCAVRLYELYGEDNMAIHSVYLKVEKMAKTVEAILDFSWNLRELKEQYKND